jgi:putative flippase GtrA
MGNLKIQKLFKFLSVGTIATLIHSIIFWLCLEFNFSGAHLANSIAFIVAFLFSYWGQTYITFALQKKQLTSSISIFNKFFVTAMFGYALNSLWVYITDSIFLVNPQWAIIGIGFITPVLTFIVMAKWVYKVHPH